MGNGASRSPRRDPTIISKAVNSSGLGQERAITSFCGAVTCEAPADMLKVESP